MPKPDPPPTPGSSSDLRGKEGAHKAPTFNLPPNAFQEIERGSTSSATPSTNGSDSSYRPVSPASPADNSRKRPATQSSPVITKDNFALPPPPTRSRKIIQMKPRESDQQENSPLISAAVAQNAEKTQSNPQAGGKRRQNNTNTTAAGRKIARKTAHSLIERRRRSKMNEEFGVLKDMIPACKGQEMHKLAILQVILRICLKQNVLSLILTQASIEYLRYLEQCVADLKAQNNSPRAEVPSSSVRKDAQAHEDDEDDEMEDDNEDDTAVSTPSTAPQDRPGSRVSLPSLSQITPMTTSTPSGFSTGAVRHYSVSSTSQASYSPYIHSNQTSPAFGPQLSHVSTGPSMSAPYSASRESFGLGSPALKILDSNHNSSQIPECSSERSEQREQASKSGRSEQELDHEATAALLMLNNDRRNWRTSKQCDSNRGNGGMSVRDLLSG